MRFFAAVIWPAICVSGVWFVLTGSFLPGIVLAFAVLSAGLARLPRSTGR